MNEPESESSVHVEDAHSAAGNDQHRAGSKWSEK